MSLLACLRVILVVSCSFLAGCVHSDGQAVHEYVPGPTFSEQFKIVTYNVLHGFEVSGWSVTPSGSKETQAARFNLQAQQLSLVQSDVILLQEVNPLPEKAQAYVTALKRLGLQYTEVHQRGACGIRLFGLAIVPGLNNGMAVLVKAPCEFGRLQGSSSVVESEAVVISLVCSLVSFGTR